LPVTEHGRTEIHLPVWSGVEQQHGFVHGGVVGMIADSAAGYAAMTLVPASASVLTIEYAGRWRNLDRPWPGCPSRPDANRHSGRSVRRQGRP
jgi:hypothetical protein